MALGHGVEDLVVGEPDLADPGVRRAAGAPRGHAELGQKIPFTVTD
jgi:hypothetical protein